MKKQIYDGVGEFYNPKDFANFMSENKFGEISPITESDWGRDVFYNNGVNITVVNFWNRTGKTNEIYSTVTLLGRQSEISEIEKMILEGAKEFGGKKNARNNTC